MQDISHSAVVECIREPLERGISEGEIKLPVLPRVAGQILQLTNDANAEMSDLSDLIHTDQALASHVLRIANSAAFSSGEPVVSLTQALARLGMRLLAEIAITISVQESKKFAAPGFEKDQEGLMRQALVAGIYSKEIARLKRRNVEGQFLCGLLHTVGKPVTLTLIVNAAKEEGVGISWPVINALLDIFHVDVGHRITAEWNLPKVIDMTTTHYRQYEDAPSFKEETAMTYLSNRLSKWVSGEPSWDEAAVRADPVWEFLNCYPDDIDTLLAKREDVESMVKDMET